MRTLTRLASVWLMLVIVAAKASADDFRPEQMQSGSLLLRMQAGYRVATLMNTDVEMQISGMVARVSVRQSFENTGVEWAEGVYVFPLPDRAAVDRMRLHIGDRFIEGEIREKEQAEKDYQQAKAEGRKASLVEQQRPNLFTTSVANIAPGERIVVEIEYLEDLRYDDGLFSLRFPFTLTPRYMPGSPLPDRQGSGWSAKTTEVADASRISPPVAASSQGNRATLRIDLDAGLALERITSRYHAVNVVETNGRYAIELASPTIPMDHDFELVWKPAAGAAPEALVFSEKVDNVPYQLLMVMPPAQDYAAAIDVPREMIFIIDTSGSMHGTSIAQAKQALKRALERLDADDRFNIIEFNSFPNALFRGTVPATANNVRRAENFVDALAANGGTEMRSALTLALRYPQHGSHLRQIVFITDGAVGNEEALFTIIEQALGDGRLFTVGIGSAPNSWFMRKAAEAGRGSYTTISALAEVGEKMNLLFEKLEQPQVTDIRVAWPGGVIVDAYPATVPDLYADEPVIVRARVSGPLGTGATVTISGDAAGGAWSRMLPLAGDTASAGVGALWARARIAALADRGRRDGDAESIRAEIIETAMAHHLVSRYTSLVAVDKTPVRTAGAALRRDQVANLMPYGQSANAIFGFPATATAAPKLLFSGAICVLLALSVMFLGRPGREHAGSV